MDIKQLRYFVQICRHHSLTKAAKNLYISQQALSKILKIMEEELQVALFSRVHDGLRLTDEGEYLLQASEKILDAFHRFETDVYNQFHIKHGLVPFAITYGALNSLSPEILLNFHETYPQIDLRREICPDSIAEQLLLAGKVEFACMERPEDLERLRYTSIKTEKFMLFAHKDHPFLRRTSVSVRDLRGQEIITNQEDTYIYRAIVRKCRQLGFEPHIVFSSMEVSLLKKLLLSGRGLLVTAEHLLLEFDRYPEITAIPFTEPDFDWHVCFAYSKHKQMSCLARTFINYVLSAFDRPLLPEKL
ncbi:MAG: LysR family transcriptional regulator [Gracilibacteraceae bacterium]|jgi:DNA-binding transcriptional LysR family regulator|nr:LysR family transcriptional regulator [Gracilibacteraceae bacterium]